MKEQVQEMKDKYDAEVQTHSKTTTLLGNGEVEKDALQVEDEYLNDIHDAMGNCTFDCVQMSLLTYILRQQGGSWTSSTTTVKKLFVF